MIGDDSSDHGGQRGRRLGRLAAFGEGRVQAVGDDGRLEPLRLGDVEQNDEKREQQQIEAQDLHQRGIALVLLPSGHGLHSG